MHGYNGLSLDDAVCSGVWCLKAPIARDLLNSNGPKAWRIGSYAARLVTRTRESAASACMMALNGWMCVVKASLLATAAFGMWSVQAVMASRAGNSHRILGNEAGL